MRARLHFHRRKKLLLRKKNLPTKGRMLGFIKSLVSTSLIMAFIMSSIQYVEKPISFLTIISNQLSFIQTASIQSHVGAFFTNNSNSNRDNNATTNINVPTVDNASSTSSNSSTTDTDTNSQKSEQNDNDTDTHKSDLANSVFKVNTTDKKTDGKLIDNNRKTISVSPSSLYVELDNGFVKNYSGLSSKQVLELFNAPMPFHIEESEKPQVLIYHTHATESFQPYYVDWFDTSSTSRSTDNDKNMVAVGKVLKAQLEYNGISVVQSDEQHDNPSYTKAYANSHKTIEEYLEEYPSIKVVLDLHRDAIQGEEYVTSPATEIDGVKLAQLMIISCSDDGTNRIPKYKDNFIFASKLQNQLEKDYPTITRPILFDSRYYNQDLSTGGLLIEFGSHGNTLEEAKNSAVCLGNSLATLLKSTYE